MPPLSSDPGQLAQADLVACRDALRGGSRTFFMASLLLPRQVCEPASALYAFCRMADDIIDLPGASEDGLPQLRDRLALAYEGRPWNCPTDRAFAEVVRRFGVPQALPEALLEGFAWDREGRSYENLSDLRAYAVRVAGSVGAMMAIVMGARSPAALARASDLGVAMQLSNIARDVAEDARNGRLYLPRSWLREAGVDPDAWLARPVFDDTLAGIVRRLLRVADDLYRQSEAGVASLPLRCRPAIRAARYLYCGIGHAVDRQAIASFDRRTVVPAYRKATLLLRALFPADAGSGADAAPPLAEASFLIDAVAGETPWPALAVTRAPLVQAVGDRIVWLIALFERLERREADARGALPPAIR
jgi:phytoene synthase